MGFCLFVVVDFNASPKDMKGYVSKLITVPVRLRQAVRVSTSDIHN